MLFKYPLKIAVCILLQLVIGVLHGNDCNDPVLDIEYRRLCDVVDVQENLYAIFLADSLIQVLESTGRGDCSLNLWVYIEKGEAIELQRDRSEEALSLYYDLVRKAEKLEHWEVLAETYISIARTHEILGRDKDCLRYLQLARSLIDKHQLLATFSRYAVRYSSYHRIFDNRDSAFVYAKLAVQYGKQFKVRRSEIDGHLLLGILNINDVETSVFHGQAAVDLYLSFGAYYGASAQKLNIVARYILAGEFDIAAAHLDTVSMYLPKIPKDYIGYFSAAERLYDYRKFIFKEKGMIDSAYYYLEKSSDARDSLEIEINQREVNQKELAFSIAREKEKLLFEQQRSQYLRWGLGGAILLLGLLLFVFLNNQRKKRLISEQNNIIKTKNEALNTSLHKQSLLLSEVHHRVKNNLQLVVSLLTLQAQKSNDNKQPINLEELSNKVHSIGLIHEQLYRSGEFEKVNLYEYVRDLTMHFSDIHAGDIGLKLNYDVEPIMLNLETVLPIGIICTELISNSLKYASQPNQQLEIQLSIKQAQAQYILNYRDNGPGYPNGKLEPQQHSIGSMLVLRLVRQLQAECETFNENGAVFTLLFTEKEVSSV